MTYDKAEIMTEAWNEARSYMRSYGMTQKKALSSGLRDVWNKKKWFAAYERRAAAERAELAKIPTDVLKQIIRNYNYSEEGEKYYTELQRRRMMA